jgi:hypothetical protein
MQDYARGWLALNGEHCAFVLNLIACAAAVKEAAMEAETCAEQRDGRS